MLDEKKGIGLRHAIAGLKTVFKNERNFRIHLLAFLLVLIFSVAFRLTFLEWCIIFIVSFMVLIIEIINSVIELMIDYLNPVIHPTAKKIKDMSASAVLLTTVCSIVIGSIIFVPKILSTFHIILNDIVTF